MGCQSSKQSVYNVEEEQQRLSQRRAGQTLNQNIASAILDKDIAKFYSVDHSNVLGTGISGSVKTVRSLTSGTMYALKTLYKMNVAENDLDSLRTEIDMMAKLDHPNILRVHEYFETDKEIFVIMPLCRGGELLDRLNAQKRHRYTESVAAGYMRTICRAISYCHSNGICHRDLKLENFIFENESDDSDLKLIDFGLSQFTRPYEVLRAQVGTPYYVAPEVLTGKYGIKCDIWSIGVIAFMLLFGVPPFDGSDEDEVLRAVKNAEYSFPSKKVSNEAKAFISACLAKKPHSRPSADTLLTFEWFKNHNNNQQEQEEREVQLEIIDSLNRFRDGTRFQKLCSEVVAHTLNDDQISDLKAEFLKFDTEENGIISLSEFKSVLSKHEKISDQDITHMFQTVDFGNTNTISYREFIAASVNNRIITDSNLRVAFDLISNHEDCITVKELQDLLGQDMQDSHGTVEEILNEMHMNADTQISFEDFKKIMRGGHSLLDSPVYRSQNRKVVKDASRRGSSGSVAVIEDTFTPKQDSILV